MNIAYLWIKNYKNIQEQGFNFSPEYIFAYEEDKKSLSIKRNEGFVKGFFHEKIYNITALVGANGTGKSTLLEFIMGEVLIDAPNWRQPFILIGTDNTIYHHPSLNIENVVNAPWRVVEFPSKYPLSEAAHAFENLQYFHKKTYFYYYNNFFDGDLYDFQFLNNAARLDRYMDLSTNFMEYDYITSNKTIESYRMAGLRRQIMFLAQMQTIGIDEKKIPLRLPQYIKIGVPEQIDVDFFIARFSDAKTTSVKLLKEIEKLLKGIEKLLNDKKTFKHNLFKIILLFGFLGELKIKTGSKPLETIGNILNSSNENTLVGIVDSLKTSLPQSINIENLKVLALFLDQNEIFNSLNPVFPLYSKGNLEEDILNQLTFLENIILKIVSPGSHILRYEFATGIEGDSQNLSSGEKAWLLLFSRFWHYKKKGGGLKGQSLVLLMDEPEMAFHPEWQRNFIKYICDFMPLIFSQTTNKKIQIILSTHSPFVVSDLPKENAIFLTKKENGGCCVSEGVAMPKTFGANIHTILSDNFFLGNGLMGEFARTKIQEIIEFLKESENSKNDQDAQKRTLYEKQIAMIGEPIIAQKLSERYHAIFGGNDDYIDKQITYWQSLKKNKKG